MPKRKRKGRVDWQEAPDVGKRINKLVSLLDLTWIDTKSIFCFRSINSTAKAYARIWNFSKVWQLALKRKPAYVIEVLSEHFDRLSDKEKDKVLIHELVHIPKNFSGSLLPHIRKRGKRNFHDKVDWLVSLYQKLETEVQ